MAQGVSIPVNWSCKGDDNPI